MVDGVDDEADWDASWLDELDRRTACAAADPIRAESWEEVRDRLFDELGRSTRSGG